MPAEMRDVYSSHVNRIGHDPDSGDLIVEWDSGKTSAYEGVPADIAKKVITNWSVGGALHELVKPTYKHRYL
jgi:hypothetical protein